MRRNLALVLSAVALFAVVPAAPAAAAVTYEVHYVPSVGGSLIRVEIQRDTTFDAQGQPVILTYSPYNSLGEPEPANDPLAERYNPLGYARAVADVIGTRGSTGCWDYGGAMEQQSGVDVVEWLAAQPWSNGNVGMIGGSYEGTTATMVAATGTPSLKAIVPIAAISRWYGYAYDHGVRYFLNTRYPTDEGFDTPLLFDFGFGDTVAADPTGQHFADTVRARAAECGAVEHTQHGYDRDPDYDAFWLERDYIHDPSQYRAAALIVHGWQDYNVKQAEAINLWEALPVDDPETVAVEGVPFKRLVMTQGSHSGLPSQFLPLQDRFFEHTLKGVDNGVDDELPVLTLGRSDNPYDPSGRLLDKGIDAEYRAEATWPPPATRELTLHLGRTFDYPAGTGVGPVGASGETGVLRLARQNDGGGWTHANPGTYSEEVGLFASGYERGVDTPAGTVKNLGVVSLYHESAPLERDARLAGSALLDAVVNAATPGQTLTPVLVDVAPDGTMALVERGFLNLDYRNGLTQAEPKAGWQAATVEFLPQDYTFRAGHRIGLFLAGSNTAWAVPGNPGALSYAMGPVAGVTDTGTRLVLPLADVQGTPDMVLPE